MVEYKTSGEIDAMHAAGQVVARILAAAPPTSGTPSPSPPTVRWS